MRTGDAAPAGLAPHVPPPRRHLLAGWQRFLTAYYVSAVLTIASYWLTRYWFLTTGGDSRYTHVFRVDALLSKERFALSLLGIALASKYYRRQSIDSFLSDALTYSKSAVVLMVWYIDWRICVLYVLVLLGGRQAACTAARQDACGQGCSWLPSFLASSNDATTAACSPCCHPAITPAHPAVSYLLFPQPIYRGASAIEQFTPASFHQLVVDSPQPADVSWLVSRQHAPRPAVASGGRPGPCPGRRIDSLACDAGKLIPSSLVPPGAPASGPLQVEFYAPWAPPCIHLEPVFAELSLKYTTERLRFGKVDASRCGAACRGRQPLR